MSVHAQSGRFAHAAPWVALASAGTACVLTVTLVVLQWGRPAVGDLAAFDLAYTLELLTFTSFALLGGVIARRRPSHPVGWLMLAAGVSMVGQFAAEEYAVQATVVAPGSLPAAVTADLLAEWMWIVPMTTIQFTALLFPTGRLPSPRWRPFAAALLTGDVAAAVLVPIAIWPARGQLNAGGEVPYDPGLWVVLGPLVAGLLAGIAISVLSLLVRYRRAEGEERFQLRWLAWAALLAVLGSVLGTVVGNVLGTEGAIVDLPRVLGLLSLPAAVAVAVLKRNLYEIDRVVSRTVSYALVTVVLAGVYAFGVLGVGTVLPGPSSDLVVAGSTLTVAALFQPVRRRMQTVVDQRFNRARYDAQQVVAGFTGRLRAEVDLGALTEQLQETVDRVVQPRSIGVVLVDLPTQVGT